jgi:hypothetical protein
MPLLEQEKRFQSGALRVSYGTDLHGGNSDLGVPGAHQRLMLSVRTR